MFGMFFFLTQFLQGAEGYSALKAGLAFLPVTLHDLRDGESGAAAARPDRPERGPWSAASASRWSACSGWAGSRPAPTTGPDRAADGPDRHRHGLAFTPLTQAAIAGVDNHDAGAASGLVNVFQQLGSTLGIGVLVTVFAAASKGAANPGRRRADGTIAVSAILIALALAVVLTVMRPQGDPVGIAEPEAAS